MTKEEWIRDVVSLQIAAVNLKMRKSREGKMPTRPKDCRQTDLGFHFTEFEELLIKIASIKAEKFMSNYGNFSQGYMIDCSHYFNSGNKKI